MGAVIGLYPAPAVGRYAAAGYQVSFALLLLIQAAALAWYGLAGRRYARAGSGAPSG